MDVWDGEEKRKEPKETCAKHPPLIEFTSITAHRNNKIGRKINNSTTVFFFYSLKSKWNNIEKQNVKISCFIRFLH